MLKFHFKLFAVKMDAQENIHNLLNQMEEVTKNVKWEETEEQASVQNRLLQIEEDIARIHTKKPRKNTLTEINSKLDTILEILMR